MPKLSLSADLAHLAAIRDFVLQATCEIGLDYLLVYDLQLAVDEACTNVIKHAYGGHGGKIEITIEATDDAIQIVIRDWGVAFDPGKVPTPDVSAPLAQRPTGGLGLFLMRHVMDQVDFRFDSQQGNTLTMIKQFQGGKDGDRRNCY